MGRRGDIVFWHHRLAHAAGQNYSEKIRQAVLADFGQKISTICVPNPWPQTCGMTGPRRCKWREGWRSCQMRTTINIANKN